MALDGWLLDKSAGSRSADPVVALQLNELSGPVFICPVGELEQLYSAQSARNYDEIKAELHFGFEPIEPPPDLLERVLQLQHDLAHHHGMWHRVPIPDLLIAEIALANNLGVVHIDSDFDRIAEVRPLVARRLRTTSP